MSPSSTVQKKGLEKECLRLKEILSFKNTCMDNPEYRGLTTEKLMAALEENNSNLTAHVSLGSICICQKKKNPYRLATNMSAKPRDDMHVSPQIRG